MHCFPDDRTFYNNESVNRRTFHCYLDSNPHQFKIIKNQHKWSMGGIMKIHLIEPYFFQGYFNIDFLINHIPILSIRRYSVRH